jgi:hypothetical protein
VDLLTREDVRELVESRSISSVSLFMPAHRIGPHGEALAKEDVIRWKNLLRKAEEKLAAAGQSAREIDPLLKPARALTDDGFFWRNQSDGLAAFLSPGMFRTFRIPLPLNELVIVGLSFHVKPLLALLESDGRFYVLALSQNSVRLIEATRDGANEVEHPAPRSLQEALRFDDPEKQTQYHTAASQGSAPRAPVIFHGQGVGVDDTKDRVLRFCQQVDRNLTPFLRATSAPLILAAVESVAAEYRQANTYPNLLEPIIPGNPELLIPKELRDRAWPIAEPFLLRARHAAAARYHEWRDTARATHDLEEVLSAATDGRVDSLFVPADREIWGTFDDVSRKAVRRDEPQAGDEDLLNLAALRTITGSGAVYTSRRQDMPDDDEVAALLRY